MTSRVDLIFCCCISTGLTWRRVQEASFTRLLVDTKASLSKEDVSRSTAGFNVEPFLSLLNIWAGEVEAEFDQDACPAPYQAEDGCKQYQNNTANAHNAALSWQSYVVPSSKEKCCTPCKFPPPCSQYDSILSTERAKAYQYRSSHVMEAAAGVLGKSIDNMEPFPCCKGNMDSRFEVAMAGVIDRLVKVVKRNPDETMLTWSYVYKGMVRNYLSANGAYHVILDGANRTLDAIAELMQADYAKSTIDAKSLAAKDRMSPEDLKELRLRKAKVAFAALNLLVTLIHVLGKNMGLWKALIDNMLKDGPTGGCSMALAEIVIPGQSGRWASLASKDAAGCTFGLSIMLTVAVAQRTPSLNLIKATPVAAKVVSVGRALKRMFFSERTTLYIHKDDLQPLLHTSSDGVKLIIKEKRREGDFNKNHVYTLDAVNGTGIESQMYFYFVPSQGINRAYLHCTYEPSSAVQEAILLAYEAARERNPKEYLHQLRFKPQTKRQGVDGAFEGLGDIAASESTKMGYDIGAIYFMWYVGYWQFFLLDATWRTGVSAWKLLQSEVEKEDVGKGPQDLGSALKGEAVLAWLAMKAKKQSRSSGVLSRLSNRSRTCAEGMVTRYVRAFAGLSSGSPEEFVLEACGLDQNQTQTPGLVALRDTLGLLEAFFGIGRTHIEETLAWAKKRAKIDRDCDSDARWLIGKLKSCGLLEWKCDDFDGNCCEDRFFIDACSDILGNDPIAQALRVITAFRNELCTAVLL